LPHQLSDLALVNPEIVPRFNLSEMNRVQERKQNNEVNEDQDYIKEVHKFD